AAAAHLAALIAGFPDQEPLFARRAHALAESEDWPGAARDFEFALRFAGSDVDQHLFRYWRALAQLAAGDVPGYRRTCAGMLAAYANTGNSRALDVSCWTCAVGPGAPELAEAI